MMRIALVVAVALGIAAPARADTATAEAAYAQAKLLVAKGDYAAACPLFEASYKADPALGAQLNMADCHEHVGKTATAWAEFDDAANKAQRNADQRAAYARGRADALLPGLSHLTVKPARAPPPGLVVTRDGTDVTVLVGTAMPVDPGPHVIAATAPGYQPWTQTVQVAVAQQASVALGELVEVPQVDAGSGAIAPAATTAAVTIIAPPDASVQLDGKPVGTGKTTVAVARGPHTLRVTAPGMRAFQQEVYVAGGDDRTIDVPLEANATVPRPETPFGPRWEAAASAAPGTKLRNEDPAVLLYRLQVGVHLGGHATLSLFAELGSISTSDACGSSLAGAVPSSPFDISPRNRFNSCNLYMGGLELDVRLARRGALVQPWLAVAPGVRGLSVSYTPIAGNGMADGSKTSDTWPGVVASLRAGADFHPHAWPAYLTVGPFVDVEATLIAKENPCGCGAGDEVRYLTLVGGLRSTVGF
jgi:hypothetical protein